jgi:hypothetical protein
MVSSNIVKVLKLNACIARTYSPTRVNAHVRRNCAHGGGKRFVSVSENLHEAKAQA